MTAAELSAELDKGFPVPVRDAGNGEAGVVVALDESDADGPLAQVNWATGRRGWVPVCDLERA